MRLVPLDLEPQKVMLVRESLEWMGIVNLELWYMAQNLSRGCPCRNHPARQVDRKVDFCLRSWVHNCLAKQHLHPIGCKHPSILTAACCPNTVAARVYSSFCAVFSVAGRNCYRGYSTANHPAAGDLSNLPAARSLRGCLIVPWNCSLCCRGNKM